MKVLCVLLLAGFLGVSGDLKCMELKVGLCNIEWATKFDLYDPVCSDNFGFYKCIELGSQECNVKNSIFVKKFLKNLDGICTKGSSKNAMYHKHKACLYLKTPMFLEECHEQFLKEISAISIYRKDKYDDEVSKVTCKWTDRIENCAEVILREMCGEEALMFRRYFSNPSLAISREVCRLAKANKHEL
ncbi:hypothetical protein TNCT_113041 [Trichonephila clavata]|uniref:DUF19 domain-containing protein n=1 Tax=Trichonephila clavata TaxID=2740835 RepID=A0A8X6HG78_TRICU|nr:hypothetical protein TNCT_113041 [Trichonephila clavata]